MNDNASPVRRPTRRELLALLGTGAAGLAGFRLLGETGRGGRDGSAAARRSPLDARAITAAGETGRVLVVIELGGGNDGLSTLVPYADPAYRHARQATLIDAEEVVRIDDAFGLHPQLAPCATRLAALHGVGTDTPTGSHFDMSARWWAGDAEGTGRLSTGFLGRLCDALADGAPVTGVSLAGVSPALLSDKAVTIGMPALDRLTWLSEDDAWSRNLRKGFRELAAASGDDPAPVTAARTGLGGALGLGALLGALDTDADDDAEAAAERERYPSTGLGTQLRLAATLLDARAGIRVVHASIGGFDTHSAQRSQHDERMRELGDALAAFAADLDRRDLAGSVLVATTSEFGRRVQENDSGTDHGTASCALLLGPVRAGLHGEAPSLTDLDADDNLKATVGFEQYYATLAETWFGIDAGRVLPSRPKPLAGVLTT